MKHLQELVQIIYFEFILFASWLFGVLMCYWSFASNGQWLFVLFISKSRFFFFFRCFWGWLWILWRLLLCISLETSHVFLVKSKKLNFVSESLGRHLWFNNKKVQKLGILTVCLGCIRIVRDAKFCGFFLLKLLF